MMSGLSGSGKTTVARQLAKENNAIHIRSDAVRKHLAGISIHEQGDASLYFSQMTDKTYQRLFDLGKLLTEKGFNVILDAKFDRIALRKPIVDWAIQNQIDFTIVYCQAPFEVLVKRVSDRREDISDVTIDLLTTQQQQQESFTDIEKQFLQQIATQR